MATVEPFKEAAIDWLGLGLAVIPCPADDGKSPKGAARGFNRWIHPPSKDWVQKLVDRYPAANVGVVTGVSGITVADIDGDERLVDHIIAEFGDTPLKVITPSGGKHLYYRSSGERSANLRSSAGLSVDIKGWGGLVIVPPSVRPSTGKPYAFHSGSFDCLPMLPAIKSNSLIRHPRAELVAGGRAVRNGERNTHLFRVCLLHASCCDDEAALADLALTRNAEFLSPLDDGEVAKIVGSAWNYEQSGRNWVGSEARAILLRSVLDAAKPFRNGSDMIALLSRLMIEHGARTRRSESFAIASRAMARAKVMGMMGAVRIRAARDGLIKIGALNRIHDGGKGTHDPAFYRFADRVLDSRTM